MKSPRRLSDGLNKYLYNCWDEALPSKDEFEKMVSKVESDRGHGAEYNVGYSAWNTFYKHHLGNFYKDRTWIKKEYPWVFEPSLRVLEAGCGVGNSLSQFCDTSLVTGCDFSGKAISLAKSRFPHFEFRMCNLVTEKLDRCDVAMMFFTLSAIDPADHEKAIQNVYDALEDGGRLVFRDFGRYDYRQIKYKADQAVKENFYRRGDGTFAYFFDKNEVSDMARRAGFRVVELAERRSLTVNRKTRSEMFRVTIKGVFQK